MQVAVVHGYFLGDSGSGVYVRHLTRALLAEGHDVTLFCQEREPEIYDFIDSVWDLDATNTVLSLTGDERTPSGRGSCRFVRPNLSGRLLVYVDGPFAGFERSGIKTFQDAPDDWIDDYLAANIAALRTAFGRWKPDVVLAQHAIMQPHVVREALGEGGPYVVTTHGSELNFSLRVDPRLVPYGLSGLSGARAVVAVSPQAAEDTVAWAASHHLDIANKTHAISPGVDTDVFTPSPSRAEAIATLLAHVAQPPGLELSPDDDVLAFVGRVGWNKGIQHAVVALAQVAASRPHAKLLVAGVGPARSALEQLAALLSARDAAAARKLALGEPELRTNEEYGPLVPDEIGELGSARVAYLGHLTSENVARLFAAADIALAPSVFPEAAALVTSEALSSGALPVATYQTGLRMMGDIVCDELSDESFRALVPGTILSTAIAETVVRDLERYPTKDADFRQRLHACAAKNFPTWRGIAEQYVAMRVGDER
jgi:glycosyltransferase involved in cell wall biosynthesis